VVAEAASVEVVAVVMDLPVVDEVTSEDVVRVVDVVAVTEAHQEVAHEVEEHQPLSTPTINLPSQVLEANRPLNMERYLTAWVSMAC